MGNAFAARKPVRQRRDKTAEDQPERSSHHKPNRIRSCGRECPQERQVLILRRVCRTGQRAARPIKRVFRPILHVGANGEQHHDRRDLGADDAD